MRGFPPRTTILPILCLIFYDILSILSGRGLVVPPVAAADEVSLILTVEYAVEYTTAKNDKTCSEYYAQKFLGNFVIGYPELQTNCRKNCPSQDIEVHIARTLTYYQQKIRFTGEIHVNGTSGYSSIACCEQELNDTVFNSINALPAIRKLDGNGTCGPANITSAGVQKTNSSYYCSNNGYTYDQRQKKCVTKPPGGIPSPPCPTPNSGCDQPCVAEVICKVGSTMFCRRANECYHNLSNRMVSNVCFEELKKITTSGDIPCDIFTTPSTDTTTPEATTVAPMPPKVAHFDLKIKGKESLKIPLKEGEERNISFTVFTNSINPSVCSHESSPCTNLSVDLMFSYQSTPKIYCRRTNQPIQQLVVAAWYIDGQPKKLNATCKMKIEAHLNEKIIVTIRAVQDFKYDGIQKQKISFTLRLDANNERDMEEKDSVIISVNDVDLEKEATCSTINDPHITTFDKLKYDVFYQGEFIYYKNDVSRTQVNMIFQNCSQEVQASCNCGVGIRADDDIFVVQKCALKDAQAFVPVETKLKISGNLTRGMRVMPRLDGFEYLIFLPEGTHVKVLFENELINVWIYASLSDFQNVKGLCGDYDGSCNNDIQSADSSSPTTINYNCTGNYNPSQYQTESKSWRVDIGGKDSLFGTYNGPCVFPPRPLYCMCDEDGNEICDEDAHFNVCDQEDRSACIDGKCDQFNENVQSSCTLTSRRKKRQTNNNNVIDANNNFDIDVNYKPPQKFNWTNDWDLSKARYQCESFLYNASEAKRCRPLVDFEPYIQSCVKDIEITGGENWKHSTKEAMVQECLLKLNNDPNQTDLSVCPKECQNSGKCLSSGACQCTEKYVGSYCQMKKEDEPTVVYLDNDGQCDTTSMQCKNVIVYGRDFIESPKLKCRLYDVTYKCNNVQGIEGSCNSTSLIVNKKKYEDIKGRFLSFNTVLCRLERLRSCSISVSNDGINYGVGKLFVPYNSHCQFCTTENLNCKSTIDQLRNYCLYLHECHAKGKGHPENECSQCQANLDGTLTWSSLQTEECKGSRLPDWGVALVAAGAGALFGILFGFLLYMCCCKCSIFERKSSRESEFVMSMRDPDAEAVFPVVPNPNIYRDQNFARYGAADDLVDDVRPVTYPNHVQYRRRTSPADDEDYDNYF